VGQPSTIRVSYQGGDALAQVVLSRWYLQQALDMGMQVDESWGDHFPGGVDDPGSSRGCEVCPGNAHDSVAVHGDIRLERRAARPVDHSSARDQQVVLCHAGARAGAAYTAQEQYQQVGHPQCAVIHEASSPRPPPPAACAS
jgi:hypothetical protein